MISTASFIRNTRERLNRRRRQFYEVLRAMHRGAALHFYGGAWTLSTGMSVDTNVAKLVITNPRIAPVDFALFAEMPAQTWRWIGTDCLSTCQPKRR
jgi:hypothetical protein